MKGMKTSLAPLCLALSYSASFLYHSFPDFSEAHFGGYSSCLQSAHLPQRPPQLLEPSLPNLFLFLLGKDQLFIFPEGGSERKKMSPLKEFRILLQNRPGIPPCCPCVPRSTDNENLSPAKWSSLTRGLSDSGGGCGGGAVARR
jgi:hypothetical protein